MKKNIPFTFLGIGALLLIVSLSIRFYKQSGKLRDSILKAILFVIFFFGEPSTVRAKSPFVEGFTTNQERTRPHNGQLSNSPGGPGKPNNDGDGDDPSIPTYTKPESTKITNDRANRIGEIARELEEMSPKQKDEVCPTDQTRTQVVDFLDKDNKPDVDKCLAELDRRAKALGRTDFKCSPERFLSLAKENGKISPGNVREAITILEGKMRGFYKNARRENYGVEVKGPDFVVEGLGKFRSISHIEVKNPVGSEIKKSNDQLPSISRQARQIGRKFNRQQKFWSDLSQASTIKNFDSESFIAKSPDNILALIDCYDVPSGEKKAMQNGIMKGSKNNPNIIFINNN
jgi:hypothetical protein